MPDPPMLLEHPHSAQASYARSWSTAPDFATEGAMVAAASDVRQPLLNQMSELAMDCWRDDWDGEGAARVSAEACDVAQRFINALPGAYPAPQVLADPDGWLAFEWYAGPGNSLFVSVDPAFRVHYAAEVGADKDYGSAAFFGRFPETLLQVLGRIYPHRLCLV